MELIKLTSTLKRLSLILLIVQCVNADMTQPFTKEQLSSFLAVLTEKCSAKKIGIAEASTAMVDARKCFDAIRPGSLPTTSSSEAAWTEFKESYAKDACSLWAKIYECYKPPIQLLERCLEYEGSITSTLETTHYILCVQQDEQELSNLLLQFLKSWKNCKLSEGEAFSETLRPCVGKYLDETSNNEAIANKLCRDEDYYELWQCTTDKIFQECEDDTLGPNFYKFVANSELKNFAQLAFGCSLSEEVRDEL